jgi:hypothetical protein
MTDNLNEAQQRAAAVSALASLAAILAIILQNRRSPVPMRSSILSGQMWLDELMAGHPERFREQFGMTKHTFRLLSRELQLHSGLVDRRYVTADEQLMIFLYAARTGSSMRILRERFQRSASTVSR